MLQGDLGQEMENTQMDIQPEMSMFSPAGMGVGLAVECENGYVTLGTHQALFLLKIYLFLF